MSNIFFKKSRSKSMTYNQTASWRRWKKKCAWRRKNWSASSRSQRVWRQQSSSWRKKAALRQPRRLRRPRWQDPSHHHFHLQRRLFPRRPHRLGPWPQWGRSNSTGQPTRSSRRKRAEVIPLNVPFKIKFVSFRIIYINDAQVFCFM